MERPFKKQRTSSFEPSLCGNGLDFCLNKRPQYFDLAQFFSIRCLSKRHLHWTRHSRHYVTLFMKERLLFLPTFTRVGRFSHYHFITSLTESTVKLDLILIVHTGQLTLHSIGLWQAFPSLRQLDLKDQANELERRQCQRIYEWHFDRDETPSLELEPLWKHLSQNQLGLLGWGSHLALLPRFSDVTYYGYDQERLVYLNFQICFEIKEPQECFL